MRVNLTATMSHQTRPSFGNVPLSLMIRPSCGVPGEFSYPTDSSTLLRMLRQKTELASTVLDRFEGELRSLASARLPSVELSERVLTDIGYFVD